MTQIWTQRQQANLNKRPNDNRSQFQRDRARILHSAAFRRLQSKTQVMGRGQNDFYRSRLTHSLEAAQIGSGITAVLRYKYPQQCELLLPPDDTLIEALCLAHDIGHPPFGHGGEVALHYMMRNFGGFEGNGQTFRIVTRLEPFSQHNGMNLSRRSLLGLLKYPQTLDQLTRQKMPPIPPNFRQLQTEQWSPAKGIFQDDQDTLDWVLQPLSNDDRDLFQQSHPGADSISHRQTKFKSFDCSIMELADDVAYGIHDLEDAIVMGIVSRADFDDQVIDKLALLDDDFLPTFSQTLADKLFSEQHHLQKEAIGALVNHLITSITLIDLNTRNQLNFSEPLLRYNASMPAPIAAALQICKGFVFEFVIKASEMQRVRYRGQQIVMELFEALASDPMRLLPSNSAKRWQLASEHGQNPHRVIADYVAGMTDDYARVLYQTMFSC